MVIRTGALGESAPPRQRQWSATDTMLYALAVGAGTDDLDLVTENSHGVDLQALPTFAAVLGAGSAGLRDRLGDWDPARTVHGTQLIELHRPLPPVGSIEISPHVAAVVDKGSGALIEIVSTAIQPGIEEPLFTSTTGLFIRGEGGFGGTGSQTHALPRWDLDDRAPDLVATTPTRADQALLYRLCGDRNPLHSDPTFARRAGFDRPILHGLCSWGIAARLLCRELLDGRTDRCARVGGRFKAPVFPGDTLCVRAWRMGEVDTAFQVLVQDRVVIDSGVFSERIG